jgi:hypothetical protein
MTTARVAIVLPMTMLSLGCASLAFKPEIQSVGEYKNTSAISQQAGDMPNDSAADIKVLVETLPEGMSVKEGQLIFDHERFEMLGKVSADYRDPSGINLGWWFYHYQDKDSWRNGLCAWQVPLSWVTLSMWAWFVPTYYPCRVHFGEEDERRASIIETMQRATKALGGNLVIVSGFGGIDFITVNGRSGVVVNASSVSTLKGTGYAFKVKGGAVEPARVKAVNL